jgi:hypothetical protein
MLNDYDEVGVYDNYRDHLVHIMHVLFYHHLEVYIHLYPLCLIHHLSLSLMLLHILHLLPPVFPVLLQPLYLFQAISLLILLVSCRHDRLLA